MCSVIIELVKILPTFIVGCIATGIAFQQRKLAQAKLKIDLFERRFSYFNAIADLAEYIQDINETDKIDKAHQKIIDLQRQASFLFGDEIKNIANEINTNIGIIAGVIIEASQNNGATTQEQIAKAVEAKKTIKEINLTEIFKPYLDLSKLQ